MKLRRWTGFDPETTSKKFLTIPQPDRRALFGAMQRFRERLEVGYIVKDYGDRLMMIKATNKSAGRCLFFIISGLEGIEVLTALLAYKKESTEVPEELVVAARNRMKRARRHK